MDTTLLVQDALAAGEHVLMEGAQGTLLDLDHGTYPFVTSSNPIAGGACTGGGIGPLQIGHVIGVLKAYSTRVGSGPFPTELDDETGTHLLQKGHEFGTTTGRQRRCGWFDAAFLRYVVSINSVSHIMLNKLDILSGLDEVLLCTGYTVDGAPVRWPLTLDELERAQPVYERFDGWQQDITGVPPGGGPAARGRPLRGRHRAARGRAHHESCRSVRSAPRRSCGPARSPMGPVAARC